MKTEIILSFTATVLIALAFLYYAMKDPHLSKYRLVVFIILFIWLGIQGFLGVSRFYLDNLYNSPPRFPLLILPAFITVISILIIPASRKNLLKLDDKFILLIHSLRIPIEIVLFLLYKEKLIPKSMTFEGMNFDIVSGLLALILLLSGKKISENKNVLLLFNFIGLVLVFAIVIQAILSVPGPLHKINLEQPNLAVFHFPMVWLPCFLVPLVILLHIVSLWKIKSSQSVKLLEKI